MDAILGFIGNGINGWATTMSSPGMRWLFAFLLLLLAVDIARRGWRLSWSRRMVQGIAATLAIFHLNIFFVPFVALASDQLKALYALAGIPSVPAWFWSGLPLWALGLVAILAYDLANYWNHRLMHMKWLWPVHAIHHSDPDVTGLTTYRVHALEMLVMWGSYTVLLSWLGLPAGAIGIGATVLLLHNVYVHVNVDWGHGPFRMLLASPRFHRWHHADVPEAYGKNLANVFPFYDWLFGTYRVPGACLAPMGAPGIPGNDVVRLMLWPVLAWGRMAAEEIAGLRARLTAWHGRSREPDRSRLQPIDAE